MWLFAHAMQFNLLRCLSQGVIVFKFIVFKWLWIETLKIRLFHYFKYAYIIVQKFCNYFIKFSLQVEYFFFKFAVNTIAVKTIVFFYPYFWIFLKNIFQILHKNAALLGNFTKNLFWWKMFLKFYVNHSVKLCYEKAVFSKSTFFRKSFLVKNVCQILCKNFIRFPPLL